MRQLFFEVDASKHCFNYTTVRYHICFSVGELPKEKGIPLDIIVCKASEDCVNTITTAAVYCGDDDYLFYLYHTDESGAAYCVGKYIVLVSHISR